MVLRVEAKVPSRPTNVELRLTCVVKADKYVIQEAQTAMFLGEIHELYKDLTQQRKCEALNVNLNQ